MVRILFRVKKKRTDGRLGCSGEGRRGMAMVGEKVWRNNLGKIVEICQKSVKNTNRVHILWCRMQRVCASLENWLLSKIACTEMKSLKNHTRVSHDSIRGMVRAKIKLLTRG